MLILNCGQAANGLAFTDIMLWPRKLLLKVLQDVKEAQFCA